MGDQVKMAGATSQNDYPVLTDRTDGPTPRLRHWAIPGVRRTLTLRDGSAGFLLVHFALWFDEKVERLDVGAVDEWGYAVRAIRGEHTGYSNHASGTAMDLNATKHQLGKTGTFSVPHRIAIRARLLFFRGCIRWGGDYNGRKDEMHFEVNKPMAPVQALARRLAATPRGKRILAANHGAREVIFS